MAGSSPAMTDFAVELGQKNLCSLSKIETLRMTRMRGSFC
jgi:hypothetical protein